MKLLKVTKKKDSYADDLVDGLWTFTHLKKAEHILSQLGDYDLDFIEELAKEALANGRKFLSLVANQRKLNKNR